MNKNLRTYWDHSRKMEFFLKIWWWSGGTMGQIRNIILTAYNGIRGRKAPFDDRKIFKKFVEIGHGKLNIVNHFTKISWIFFGGFGQKYKPNWKFSATRVFEGGTPEASELSWIFPKFLSWHLNFFVKFAGRPPRRKLILHYSEYKWFAPEKI